MKWIAVEDKLPPYNTFVLLKDSDQAYIGKIVKTDHKGHHYKYVYNRKCSVGISIIDIVGGFTHWESLSELIKT